MRPSSVVMSQSTFSTTADQRCPIDARPEGIHDTSASRSKVAVDGPTEPVDFGIRIQSLKDAERCDDPVKAPAQIEIRDVPEVHTSFRFLNPGVLHLLPADLEHGFGRIDSVDVRRGRGQRDQDPSRAAAKLQNAARVAPQPFSIERHIVQCRGQIVESRHGSPSVVAHSRLSPMIIASSPFSHSTRALRPASSSQRT